MTAPAAWIFAALAGVGLAAQVDTQALPRMVATERAFAAATAEIGVRDGFLTFFSDDAISLDAGRSGATTSVSRAKDGLVKQSLSKLPILSRLMWEPSTGQISEDGTLGWLTGPYAVLGTHDEGRHESGRLLQCVEAPGRRDVPRVARRRHYDSGNLARRG